MNERHQSDYPLSVEYARAFNVEVPPPEGRNLAPSLPRESRPMDRMQTHTSKLAEKLLIIYEMDGREAVEQYARRNGIPLAVCSKIVSDYEVGRGLSALATGKPPL